MRGFEMTYLTKFPLALLPKTKSNHAFVYHLKRNPHKRQLLKTKDDRLA